MYQLDLTQKLDSDGFSPLILAQIECDALALARRLVVLDAFESATPGVAPQTVSPAAILERANTLLPAKGDPNALRMFFSTEHQMKDGHFDSLSDMGKFISARANHLHNSANDTLQEVGKFVTERASQIEARAQIEMGAGKGHQWRSSLAYLGESYSHVLEAANRLQEVGLVALRKRADFEALVQRPDEQMNPIGAQLFDKATAFMQHRNENEQEVARPRG